MVGQALSLKGLGVTNSRCQQMLNLTGVATYMHAPRPPPLLLTINSNAHTPLAKAS